MTTGIRRDQIRGWEIRAGEIGAAEIEDGSITPTEFASSVYGTGTTTIDPDDATNHGASTALSRTDHQHQFTTAAATSITNSNAEGSATSMARSDHDHAFGNGSVSELAIVTTMPRGVIAQQILTSNESAAHSATEATDMVFNNLSVVQSHVYAFHLKVFVDIVGTGTWQLRLTINGSVDDRFERGLNTDKDVDATVYWTAPTTQATDDFVVQAQEESGTATLQLVGAADAPRYFTCIDLGVI